ncbi:dihydroneopterin aldolase/2-amino-4-hydroxy-6-hydroxymethyldihydropteridine diphosphokinase [Motilibacter peucedani]|uniref:Bifunctional folate synthesis protein n=1 Tax=Motilibacter peucedani TaxID=598650 RepID=A0A420XPT5_9ACTN|nr:2-amino-4-hydroxy-6-hydroxymethyldihydropteridine diphosphokinase [Motilibacter peucedani]RKS75277.1 dihydroneopterin aldolase/2-amino-4-hydroxy-6-hydroxymethyldihydropteridine diphosphokinase [Motilibacter peucedani]
MPTTDRIEIVGLRAFGRHGVFAHEREQGQDFVVDVVLEVDLEPAGRTDELAATVNYGVVSEAVVARIGGEPFDLIESLADRIAADALAQPLVQAVEVTVHKPSAPITVPFTDVTVRIRRAASRCAVVALGANLGDRRAALQGAVWALGAAGTVRAVSPVFETAALTLPGAGPQPDYLNAVVLLDTALEPASLLAHAHAVEASFGRERTERWGARTLDVDLVAVEGVTSTDPALTLPHPRAHERAFVLAPWAALAPSAQLPGRDGRVAELLAALPDDERAGVRRRDDLALAVPVAPLVGVAP